MGLDSQDAQRIDGPGTKKGVHIWPAPTCVTSPQFNFMADTMASGDIGKVTAAHGTYGHNGPDVVRMVL